MARDEFYEVPEEQNLVKTQLVSKYFDSWSTIMLQKSRERTGRIAYIDLFAGKGTFDDGTPSTPLWVLRQAVDKPALADRLVTVFNDRDPEYARQLGAAISDLPGIERLKYPPEVTNLTVGSELTQLFRNLNFVPTLFFIDPWGYKGLSIDLIGATIKNWGCDCIFFFNYNRINPGISNAMVANRMNDLFGADRAKELSAKVANRSPDERQRIIIDELSEALKSIGGRFVLPFEFVSPHGDRPSHYVIFVSKAFLGYHLMKEAMFSLSSDEGNVRQLVYVPVKSSQLELFPSFGRSQSIELLKDVILHAFAGESLRVWDCYERITVDTSYTLRNVKDAIIELEAEYRATVDKPAAKRMRLGRVTLGDDRIVTFSR